MRLFAYWSYTWPVLRIVGVAVAAAGTGVTLRGWPWVGVPMVLAAAVGLFLANEIPRRGELRALREAQARHCQQWEAYERRRRRRKS